MSFFQLKICTPVFVAEDRQSGKHQKRKQICIDGYMAWKIHDLFKRTLKKAKYTPLLDPLMEAVARKVLIHNVIA